MSVATLREGFGDAAVDLLLARIRSGASREIDPDSFREELASAGLTVDETALLDAAAAEDLVQRQAYWRCPVGGCGNRLDAEALVNRHCPHCDTSFDEIDEEPAPENAYFINATLSRTIPWLIAVHGMNTLGPWQEAFAWRIANRLKYHAPVLIYKYGWISASVLVRWRHAQLARGLGMKIRAAIADAGQHQIAEPPDIIVHSFGSQLFRLVLESKDFNDLSFGRVIICGGIVRPDFQWSKFMRKGRIEAVLAQLGGRDKPVLFAQFMIPGTGPGGRTGYSDPAVINLREPDFGHSDCFREQVLKDNLTRDGLWDRFLREPIASFEDRRRVAAPAWRPWPRPLRGLVRLIAVAAIVAVSGVLVWLAAKGIVCVVTWLRGLIGW